MKYAIKIGAKAYDVEVGEMIAGQVLVAVNGKFFDVTVDDFMAQAPPVISPAVATAPASTAGAGRMAVPAAKKAAASTAGGSIVAPMPGLILEIKVKVGDAVEPGQCVATMEAMKMENDLPAIRPGIVKEILVQKGSEVSTGDMIMRIE